MNLSIKAPKVIDALSGIEGAPALALPNVSTSRQRDMIAWIDQVALDIRRAQVFVFENVPLGDASDGTMDLPGVTEEELAMIGDGLIPLPYNLCWFEIAAPSGAETLAYLLSETEDGFVVAPFRVIEGVEDVPKEGAIQISGEVWCISRNPGGGAGPSIQVNDPFGGGAIYREFSSGMGLNLSPEDLVRGEVGMISYLLIMLSSRTTEIEQVAAPEKLNRARQRRGNKAPIPAHRIVSIIPRQIAREMRREVGASSDARTLRSSPRLHWRRSHIRVRDGKSMVVARHLVGYKAADGREMVTHDYRVRL